MKRDITLVRTTLQKRKERIERVKRDRDRKRGKWETRRKEGIGGGEDGGTIS